MKKWFLSLLGCSFLSICFAQEKPASQTNTPDNSVKEASPLSISGYVQAQYQWGQEEASLKVGGKNKNPDEPFDRFGIRRGRIKFAYEKDIASGVFQLDITEKGLGIKDAYLNIKDPWFKTSALRAGVFDRPFGFEISYSSSRRESPERSTIFQTLFPEERDLGAMLQLQADKNSPLHFIRLDAGLFAGNGIKQETDNRKDFIGHLSASKSFRNHLKLSGGFSYYQGSVYQGTENVYKMKGASFVANSHPDNTGKFAKRQYFGWDAQFSIVSPLGMTQLRGEYLFGQQPGDVTGSKSPNASEPLSVDTYIRPFSGGYLMLVQDLGTTPLSAVLKYDWYDPNTNVKKDEIGLNHTGAADIEIQTVGLGIVWSITGDLRLQAYYEWNNNERTKHIETYHENRKDNVCTVRMQYKF